MKKCPKCGSRIREGSAFCVNCGAKLSSGKFLKKKKHNSPKKLWGLVILAVAVLLGATIAHFMLRDRNENVTVGNAEEAISLLSKVGQDYGYENALSEMTEVYTETVDGDTFYRLQQNYQNIPVYGRTAVVTTDENNILNSMTGNVMDVSVNFDLTPTLSLEEVHKIVEHFVIEQHGATADTVAVDKTSSSLYMYVKEETACAHLVYKTTVSFQADTDCCFDVLIDSHNGEVVDYVSKIYTAMENYSLRGKNGENLRVDINRSVDGEDTVYSMEDEERLIRIISANNSTLKYEFHSRANGLIKDSDGNMVNHTYTLEDLYPVWVSENGITKPETTDPFLFPEKAISLLHHIQNTYDFYKKILGLQGVGKVNDSVWLTGCYDDYNGGDDTNAYSWGYAYLDIADTLISFGTHNSLSVDVVAHEYTHAVEAKRSNMLYKGESGAIMEALSDIFGELVEGDALGQSPDWIHNGTRNIIDPSKKGFPSTYHDKNWKDVSNRTQAGDWGGVHYNSTVLSRATYLMWNGIDGDEHKKLSSEELAKLWYRAILMMPSDCTFVECREIVELAAESMNLSSQQVSCVSDAFDIVKISGKDNETVTCDYNLRRSFKLCVYEGNGSLCDNYTVQINKALSVLGVDIKNKPSGFGITHEITTSEPYEIELAEDGAYIFTIINNSNPENTITFTADIRENKGETSISIYTRFNENNVQGVVYEIVEENGKEIHKPVIDAKVSVFSHVDKSRAEVSLQSDIEGYFKTNLLVGDYTVLVEADGYISQSTSFSLTEIDSVQLPICLTSVAERNEDKQVEKDGKKLTQVNITYSDGTKGQTVFKYNSSGLLTSSVFTSDYSDGSQETVYSYDSEKRLTTIQLTGDHWHAGFPSAEYNYDANGYLIRSAGGEGSVIEYLYENDSVGRPIKVTMNSDFQTTVSNYTYSESGNAAEIIISVTDYQGNQSQGYASYEVAYDAQGRIQTETRNGTDDSYNHNYIYDYFPFTCVASGNSTPHSIYLADIKGHPIWEIENAVVKSMNQDTDGYLTQLITNYGVVYEFVYEKQNETDPDRSTTEKQYRLGGQTQNMDNISFKDIPSEFVFSSGAGGWGTYLTIEADGSFKGEYHDSDMGITGEGYPRGTVYICDFDGKFSEPQKASEYVYSMKLESLNVKDSAGTEYIENEIRYIVSEPYGMENADEFYIYLPGASLAELPEAFLSWSHIDRDVWDTLPSGYYGIYNAGGEKGFTATEDDCIWNRDYMYYYQNRKAAMWPRYYGKSHVLFWPESGASVIDLQFAWKNDNQTEFDAYDANGSGEYHIKFDISDDMSTVNVSATSVNGVDLSSWGGTSDGHFTATFADDQSIQ